MVISYKPLMLQLLKRDMGKMDFLYAADINMTILSKLSKNQPVKLEMMMKNLYVLHCRTQDVVKLVEDGK